MCSVGRYAVPTQHVHAAPSCAVQVLIDAGADIEALDTYGYTPLHRMASNNLAAVAWKSGSMKSS